MHPRRPKLIDQIWSELTEGIESGRWSEWLPQERELAAQLSVSRSTLRLALRRLRAERLVECLRSKGNRILQRKTAPTKQVTRTRTINLMVPAGSWPFPQSTIIWVETLRAQLAANGYRLRVIHSGACYLERPERALEELTQRNQADCWLIRSASVAMQRWLVKQEIPAVLMNTPERGLGLPCIEVNQRALMQHSLGLAIAGGHRRIGLLCDRESTTAETELEREFLEMTNGCDRHPDLHGNVIRFGGGISGLGRCLEELLRRTDRPSLLIVPDSIYCLTIWSYFGMSGVRVPDDLSVIAHVGTSDLSYLRPEPAHYELNVHAYVQKIVRTVLARTDGVLTTHEILILPEFMRGGSLGRIGSAGMTTTSGGSRSRSPFETPIRAVA